MVHLIPLAESPAAQGGKSMNQAEMKTDATIDGRGRIDTAQAIPAGSNPAESGPQRVNPPGSTPLGGAA